MPPDPELQPDEIDEIEEIDPREAARLRRRDHDIEAERRELMRPGMGKVFKQIQDSWGRAAADEPRRDGRGTGRPHR